MLTSFGHHRAVKPTKKEPGLSNNYCMSQLSNRKSFKLQFENICCTLLKLNTQSATLNELLLAKM